MTNIKLGLYEYVIYSFTSKHYNYLYIEFILSMIRYSWNYLNNTTQYMTIDNSINVTFHAYRILKHN